jgi:hypothetical protein
VRRGNAACLKGMIITGFGTALVVLSPMIVFRM